MLFEVEEGSGGTGGGDARWLNGDCPKLVLNPVGSTTESVFRKTLDFALKPTCLHTTKTSIILE
jgi:hypothetical protein